MSNALVTVAVGMAYESIAKLTHPTLKRYADKLGCDFVVIDKYNGSPYCAKLFSCRLLEKYERIMFMDTDIIVREDCPDLLGLVPNGVFGGFDEHLLANENEKTDHVGFMKRASDFYAIPMDRFRFFNTGVMVLSQQHRPLFDDPSSFLELNYYDQLLINLRLGHMGFPTQDIGHKFNRMYYVDGRVPGTRLDSYIIHYAGIQKCLDIISTDLDRWA